MSNRLAAETSPYLLQHADNPVDWYPWGAEALQAAQERQQPIFLSIGYSACHWCHVMERETFTDPRLADYLNARFVSVKVDREERPDLDAIYMEAVQALTGHGGWPLTAFLTPDGEPFLGGTYYPPEPRHGLPSFAQVLQAVHDAWQTRRQDMLGLAAELRARLQETTSRQADGSPLGVGVLDGAAHRLVASHDAQHGGWGVQNKFPHAMAIAFLLTHSQRTGGEQMLEVACQSLDAMATGGIYDHLGGGFHRYSVDVAWRVPHFEKMLYDNALLARLYLHAYQRTRRTLYRSVVEETLEYVQRELTTPDGGFCAAQDADSEGQEGRYFVWTPAEIRDALGNGADAFLDAYAVTEPGDLDGANVLRFVGDAPQRAALGQARQQLHRLREQRVPPARDDKVLASWNGLMLAAYAEAARTLSNDDYRCLAERNAAYILQELWREGRLMHVCSVGRPDCWGSWTTMPT